MKIYGSLNNRFDENHYFNGTYGNLQVGTYATEYLWSDRHAYEITEVIDQGHVFIRPLKAIRTDSYGMSDSQTYRYESDPKAVAEEIMLKNGKWRHVKRYNKANMEKAVARMKEDFKDEEVGERYAVRAYCSGLTEKQRERMMAGKEIVKLQDEINISFGIADEYYDYSF